jgi:hypothetical protein
VTSPDDANPPIGTGPRLVSPAEFAAVLKVTEDDVRGWIAEGKLPAEPGPDGEPLLSIIDEAYEEHDGGAMGFVMYSADALGSDEIGTRRREREREGYAYDGPIDADALVAALARRLADVVPDAAIEAPYRGMVYGVDVAWWLSGSEDRSPEELVAAIAAQVMENTSERVADETAEPWPARAGQFEGGFAPVGTEVRDRVVRMWWGNAEAPVLELEPLLLAEVVSGFTAS